MDATGKSIVSVPHQIVIRDRRLAELTGITNVDNFDDGVVVAYTDFGELIIRGTELHVCQLDLDCGVLSVEGRIDSLTYSDVKKGGFWGRLLR